MGMFDSVLGGMAGAEMISLVNGLIEKHGGVQGVITQLQQSGLTETVKSWVQPGSNLPISAQQVHQTFGAETIQALAAKSGLDPQEVAQKLSALLPTAIDKLTPGGVIPKA
jgi:uncharacterized protein YidB (DUF937 family)